MEKMGIEKDTFCPPILALTCGGNSSTLKFLGQLALELNAKNEELYADNTVCLKTKISFAHLLSSIFRMRVYRWLKRGKIVDALLEVFVEVRRRLV